jgi:hypothetical protein
MKNQSFTKKLHKPAQPMVGKAVLGAAILLAVGAFALLFQQQSVSPMQTSRSTPPPIPTSILAQSPNTTPTLIPTNGWKTYHNYGYHFSVMLPPEIIPPTSGDAVFNPYSANGFLFSEQGDPQT